MRKTIQFLGLLSIVAMLGCAGSRIPLPKSDEFTLYARGLSTDQTKEENADAAAKMVGRNELATMIQVHIRSLTKQASEQVGIGKNSELNSLFSQAIKQTVDQTFSGSTLHDAAVTKWVRRLKAYRAEVVMKIDTGPVNEQMLDNIKQRQRLYERFRTSALFKEMEEEIEKQRASGSGGQ